MNVARIALLVACSAVLEPSAARAQSDPNAAWTWTSIGPASATSVFGYKISGRVSSIAVKQDGSILIAAANGGIWQRSNGGGWTNLSPDLTTLSFGAVAFAPSLPIRSMPGRAKITRAAIASTASECSRRLPAPTGGCCRIAGSAHVGDRRRRDRSGSRLGRRLARGVPVDQR